MVVVTRPTGEILGIEHPLAVAADAGELRRRITRALRAGGLGEPPATDLADLLDVAPPGPPASSGEIVVLACDVDIPRELAVLRRLRREQREAGIVAVLPVATGTSVRRALDAGADAIVFEPELEMTLAVAVTAVASGQAVVPRKFRASVERPALSNRERQVLRGVARGLTNAQIAEELYLSESTIKSHLSSAFAKFGASSRREAAALFREFEPAEQAT